MSSESRPELVHRSTCRACDARDPERILVLGPTPLANAFLKGPEEFAAERSYPLDLYFCTSCGLLQLLDVVDPEILFRHYLYVTGASATQTAHNRAYAATVTEMLALGPADLVAEAASNDGNLLKAFAAHGVRTLGIEPARNLAAEASAAGLETLNDFFSLATARRLRAERGAARVVAANNVLAHVDDPRDFLAGCRELVSEDGLVTVEVPYLGELLERVEYDTVYHEHLSYFAVGPLLRLAEAVGLHVVRIDRFPVHGGTLRLYLSRSASAHGPDVLRLQAEEERAGLMDLRRYRRFAEDVQQSRVALLELLEREAAAGNEVVGYGAPAKGNTLLNFCGIDVRLVRYTVDRNPRKVGLFTPGAHLPVREVSALLEGARVPDAVLILAWNLADEIMQQQQIYRDRGGRFILPVPRATVV